MHKSVCNTPKIDLRNGDGEGWANHGALDLQLQRLGRVLYADVEAFVDFAKIRRFKGTLTHTDW